MAAKPLYNDRDYLDAKFAEIEALIKPLVKKVSDLEESHTTQKAYARVFNWIAFTVIPAISGVAGYFGAKVGVVITH